MTQGTAWRPDRLGRLSTACAVALLVTVGTTGCSQDSAEDRPARGIVVNLGGEVALLNDLDAKPEIVGKRPDGTEALDAYRLTDPRQLRSGEIVGIHDGGAVSLTPEHPDRSVLLGEATAWFPAADGKKLWTVTEGSTAAECGGQELPRTVRAKFTVTKRETTGRPSRQIVPLSCGIEPVAETAQGILAHQTTGDLTAGKGAKAKTSVVLLNKDGTAVARVLAEAATALASSANRVVWRPDDCSASTCVKTYDAQENKTKDAPDCEGGNPIGAGVIDPSGRWYATAVGAAGGSRVAVLDLDRNSCRDLGKFPSLLDSDSDLDKTLAAAWSGSNLILLDQRSGELATLNAPSGRLERRDKAMSFTGGAQIWGARNT
ncbi:hypothetical protein [Streptomyces sp. NPDC005283]|uniref:hypothetical protein n=1 Tax=Streptomyces sp. NPDC005283 TaxID=3156871 RepID=UPI003452E69E